MRIKKETVQTIIKGDEEKAPLYILLAVVC